MNNIFPSEIMEYTAEYHFNKNNPKTMVIYQSLLILVFAVGIALFFVKVDVSVKSIGMLRTFNENNTIKSIVSGRVEEVFVKENQHVQAGEVILKIRADILDQQATLLQNQEDELGSQLDDLKKLSLLVKNNRWQSKPLLMSSLYRQQFMLFWQRVSQVKNRLAVVKKNFDRYAFLYKKKVISAAEYDEANFNYEHVKNELQLIYDEQGSQWQSDLNTLSMQVKSLNSRLKQSDKEKEFYTIKAPISGTIQNFNGLQPGSAIVSNEVIAEISSDSGLIAEVYVLPKDIGYLKKGTPVNFQIEAFDYNQWGFVQGGVLSVSGDIYTNREQPYFKVLAYLKKRELTLKNGYVGKLKKGMTLQARFFVTKRTLFQLLYDKVDDWLNPNIIAEPQAASINR